MASFPVLPVSRLGTAAALEAGMSDFGIAEDAARKRGHDPATAELIGCLFMLRRLGFSKREAESDAAPFFTHIDPARFNLILEGVYT